VRWQFRCRGSRRESAVAQLSTLGHMSILPLNSHQWFTLLLLPFKAFVIAAPLGLAIAKQDLAASCPDTPRFRGGIWFNDDVALFVWVCILSLLAFSVAAIIQSCNGLRHDALVSAIYTAVSFVAIIFISSMGLYSVK
jgi:hypothetical protein